MEATEFIVCKLKMCKSLDNSPPQMKNSSYESKLIFGQYPPSWFIVYNILGFL